MLASLLGTLLLFAPAVHDFDGLKLTVPAPPNPPVTEKHTTTWEGAEVTENNGEKKTSLMYGVSVTNLKDFPQKPTEADFLRFHENTARTRKPFAAQNLRRTPARIGEHTLLVMCGSILTPDAAGRPATGYWVSCAFLSGDKAYEFFQVSGSEFSTQDALTRISEMRIAEGGTALKISDAPKDFKGEYRINGLPFGLTTGIMPFVSTVTPNDPTFGGQYTAVMTRVRRPTHLYKVREVKPDDKRTDAELFRALVSQTADVTNVPLEKFVVTDGSGTVEFEYKKADEDHVGYMRFERAGKWVAVLVGYARKSESAGLKDTTLQRIK